MKLLLALAVAFAFVVANADTVPYPVKLKINMSLNCTDGHRAPFIDHMEVVETLKVFNGYGLTQVKMMQSKFPTTAFVTLYMNKQNEGKRALQFSSVVGEGWTAVEGVRHTVYFDSLNEILGQKATAEVRIDDYICSTSIRVTHVQD